ncbi:MAG: hypothetical protein AAFV53_30390 [Myxococcota bacterium]
MSDQSTKSTFRFSSNTPDLPGICITISNSNVTVDMSETTGDDASGDVAGLEDRIAFLDLETQRKDDHIDALMEEAAIKREQHAEEVDDLKKSLSIAVTERDSLRDERDTVIEERDSARADRDKAIREQDRLMEIILIMGSHGATEREFLIEHGIPVHTYNGQCITIGDQTMTDPDHCTACQALVALRVKYEANIPDPDSLNSIDS